MLLLRHQTFECHHRATFSTAASTNTTWTWPPIQVWAREEEEDEELNRAYEWICLQFSGLTTWFISPEVLAWLVSLRTTMYAPLKCSWPSVPDWPNLTEPYNETPWRICRLQGMTRLFITMGFDVNTLAHPNSGSGFFGVPPPFSTLMWMCMGIHSLAGSPWMLWSLGLVLHYLNLRYPGCTLSNLQHLF